MCQAHRNRPHPKAFFRNLAKPVPWPEKIRLFLRNHWIKLKNVQGCCGHPGEPGC